MPMFLVIRRRSGPEWDPTSPMEQQSAWPEHAAFMDSLVEEGVVILGGPLEDAIRVPLAMEPASEAEVDAILARDPWNETHLTTDSVERWTIRLDGRRRGRGT